ncbi:MAG: hypothetical protein M1829_005408 [Trizodia sp. TS-e1964]|nr:MAG: hypothetical protein M1829_005408 [Trizodia sp. TS-e1964]
MSSTRSAELLFYQQTRDLNSGTSSSSPTQVPTVNSQPTVSSVPPSCGFPQGKLSSFYYPASSKASFTSPGIAQPDTMVKNRSMKISTRGPIGDGQRSPMSPRMPSSPFRKSSASVDPISENLTTSQTSLSDRSGAPTSSSSGGRAPLQPSTMNPPTNISAGEDGSESSTKTFFSNYKASQSSSRLQTAPTIRQVPESNSSWSLGTENSSNLTMFTLPQSPDSSPDLSLSTGAPTANISEERDPNDTRQIAPVPRIEAPVPPSPTSPVRVKKAKPKPFAQLINRARSIRTDGPTTPMTANRLGESGLRNFTSDQSGLRTAPIQHDKERSFRDMMSSNTRQRSSDRHHGLEVENPGLSTPRETGKYQSPFSSSTRDSPGTGFLSGLKSSSTKAADGIGKVGKGFLGKIRNGNNVEKEVVEDEHYTCSVINLPLVEQTRKTRISSRLEYSKDKTEFWMPSLPWRCIDYLNFKGCEEEGLYRIPGSGPRVKEWQRRFDTELDIDLFNEPDLYDINIIGSMFKAWLRELPDDIFPKSSQLLIAEKCAGATETPQLLKDELSKLPPFNYYLLFAITCHLSLLHSYVDKNKMDYRNLCICFQPCLRIDGFCFQFLVCDWKNCWQGCWTEKEALEAEYLHLDGMLTPSLGGSTESFHETNKDRLISSSHSSRPTATSASSGSGKCFASQAAITTESSAPETKATAKEKERDLLPTATKANGTNSQQLPLLSPMAPMSPLGI